MLEGINQVIERYRLGQPATDEAEFIGKLATSTQEVSSENIINLEEIDPKEQEEIDRMLYNLRMSVVALNMSPVVASGVSDSNSWIALSAKEDRLADLSSQIGKQFSSLTHEPGHSYQEIYTLGTVELGKELALRATYREMQAIARRGFGGEVFDRFVRVSSHIDAPYSGIVINGVSLENFVSTELRRRPLMPLFEYLVINSFIVSHDLPSVILEEQDSTYKDYPGISKDQITTLPTRVFGAMITPAEILKRESYAQKDPVVKESYRFAAQISQGIADVRKRTAAVLFDPNDKDFPEIKELTATFINGKSTYDRLIYLIVLGLNNSPNIPWFYQNAYELAKGKEANFYLDLAMAVREFNDYVANSSRLNTDEDIVSILEDDKKELTDDEIKLTLKNIAQSLASLRKYSKITEFELDPEEITWDSIVPANTIKFQMTDNRPGQVILELGYINEFSEELDVKVALNCPKEQMFWNFIESPMSPETPVIAAFRNNLLLLIDGVLSKLKTQFEPQKVNDKSKVKRERFTDPIYSLRKVGKMVSSEVTEATQANFSIEDFTPGGYKKEITIPDGAELDKLLAKGNLDPVDARIVKRSLVLFNENGIGGKFQRKVGARTKEPRYTLSINGTSSGIRVLMEESGSEAGTQRFRIETIGYRGSIYTREKNRAGTL
jgi:hypothetical protein